MLQCGCYLQLQTAAGQWNLLQLELHHASMPGRDLHRPTARHPPAVLPPDEGLPPDGDEGLPPDPPGLPPADEGLLVVACLLVVRSKKTNDPDLAGVVLLVVGVVRGAVVVVVVGAAVDAVGLDLGLESLASTLHRSVKHSTCRM